MRKMIALLLMVGVLMLGTISVVAGSSEPHPKDITYPPLSDEVSVNPTPCGGGSDGGGGAPG